MWISDAKRHPERSPTGGVEGSHTIMKNMRFFTSFRMTEKKGFTLIELLVVVAIIGILATISSVSLTQARRRARDTRRISDIQQIRNGLVIYANQRATYPPADSSSYPTATLTLGVDVGCLDDTNEGFKTANTCTNGLEIMKKVPAEQVPAPRAQYTYSKTA